MFPMELVISMAGTLISISSVLSSMPDPKVLQTTTISPSHLQRKLLSVTQGRGRDL